MPYKKPLQPLSPCFIDVAIADFDVTSSESDLDQWSNHWDSNNLCSKYMGIVTQCFGTLATAYGLGWATLATTHAYAYHLPSQISIGQVMT